MRRSAGILVALGVLLLSGPVSADEIHLKDGTVIHGSVLLAFDGRTYIQTREEKLVTVASDDILVKLVPKEAEVTTPKVKPKVETRKTVEKVKKTAEPSAAFEPVPPPAKKPAVPESVEALLKELTESTDLTSMRRSQAISRIVEAGGKHVEYLHWMGHDLIVKDTDIGILFLKAIGEARHEESFARLLNYTGHPVPIVRAAALDGCARSRNPGCVTILGKGLEDSETIVFEAAREGLVTADREKLDVRTELWKLLNSPDEGRRLGVVRVLSLIEGEWGFEALNQLFNDPSSAVRLEALRGAAVHPDRINADEVARRLEDSETEIRKQACKLLGAHGEQKFVPELTFVLGDSDPEVVKSAAAALQKITGKKFGEDQAAWLEWWESSGQ